MVHVETKRKTTNVEEIAAALNQMVQLNGVNLSPKSVAPDEQLRFDIEDEIDDEEHPRQPQASKQRQIAERLDEQLKLATQPLETSCTRIRVLDTDKTPLVTLGSIERAIIVEPLTLPPPRREWFKTFVRFVRIHNQTGRALFYFRLTMNLRTARTSLASLIQASEKLETHIRQLSTILNIYRSGPGKELPQEVA